MKNILKNKIGLILAVVTSLVFSSCEESDNTFDIDDANKEPIAVADRAETNFEYKANFLTVAFKNTTPEVENFEYSWVFGDGTKSSEVNPVHTYKDLGKDKKGKFIVMLTAQFQNTTKILIEKEITVVKPIQPKASFSAEVDAKEVTFKSLSSGASSFEWDFGDGNTSIEENPVHTYATVGDFEVTLNVKGEADLEDTSTRTVTTTAGFIAVIINGTIDEDVLGGPDGMTDIKQNNNDPWSMKKDDPRGGGKNDALNNWIKALAPGGKYLTAYVFDNIIVDETNLSTNLAENSTVGTDKKYVEQSITFTATSDKVLFYAKRVTVDVTVTSGADVFIDDVSIEDITP